MSETRSIAAKKVVCLGMTQFPVTVYSAVQAEESLKNLCDDGHAPSPCKQGSLACAACKREATPDKPFKKGREVTKGVYAVIDLDAVADAKVLDPKLKDTMVVTPHPIDQVGAMLPGGKVYALQPEMMGEYYATVRQHIADHPEVAFTTVWAVRSKPAMYRLVAFGDHIMLTELAWPADVKEQAPVAEQPNTQLLAMFDQFLGQIVQDFDPANYVDTAAQKINDLLAATAPVAGAGVTTAAGPSNVTDLMAAMRAQIEAGSKPKAKSKTKVA